MPPPSSRMTKNRAQPTRYRPGKAEVEDHVSEEESSEEDDDERPAAAARAPPPKAASFPRKLAVDVSKAGQQVSRPADPKPKPPNEELEGFVTASESSDDDNNAKYSSGDDDGSSSGSEADSSEGEDSSSDDEPAKPLLRPTFIPKAKRAQQPQQATTTETSSAKPPEPPESKTDALLAAHLAREAAARAAGKKAWDDDDIAPADEVDDTDDLDPEAELAAWKLRELKRVRRDRAKLVEKEKEREEVERRRGLTAEEREAEDAAYLEGKKLDGEGGGERGKMGFMQKYFHKGAFFGARDGEEEQDEEVKAALNRDFAGAKFEDETGDKSLLPEYMRVRDMTRLGRKGRSKYKDLRAEDTGRWGAEVGKRGQKRDGDPGLDERFRPDDDRRGDGRETEGPTGANSAALGERKRARYE